MNKVALITGVSGQDGSYLVELLLKKNYVIHGIVRHASTFNRERIDELYTKNKNNFFLHYGDLADASSLHRIIEQTKPHEIYNLGAQSHVKRSFEIPEYTSQTDALGALRLLDIIKNKNPNIKFYQASTSELYGNTFEKFQNEKTPFMPCSPYAASKLFAYWLTKNYQNSYGIFACNGILFNHESPRRGKSFVTRKISLSSARIAKGLQNKLFLGNLSAKRDWGYAKEYVEAMWLMLQQNKPDDFVIATGESYTVREFCELAFAINNIEIIWSGTGLEEKGINKATGKVVIEVDKQYFRPTDVNILCGDASKAKKILKWEPKVKFKELVKILVEHDIELIDKLIRS